jgi:hypothetical protein
MIAANRLGNTRVIQFRRARFELFFPAFTKEDFDKIEQAALSLASDDRTASRIGIGYWIDEFLGNHEHVFAVMGPNVHYGPISIMFGTRVLKNPQAKIAINSSTTLISGHALPLRPWLKLAAKEFKATQYGGCVAKDYTFQESISVDLGYFVARYSVYGAIATRGELELLKQLQRKDCFSSWVTVIQSEITSQAILAFMKDRSKYDIEPERDYLSYGAEVLKQKDPHFSWVPKMDLIAGSFPPEERKKDRPEDVTTQDIIDWYLNVDPHGRVEALLPSSIPLTDVDLIIIPRTAVTPQLSKLLKETKVGGRRLMSYVVFTENEEESLKWQQQWFSVLCD